MSYADKRKEINIIDQKIQKLQNERYFLEQFERIESYIERSNILGKCYKQNNRYYKIIDLEISNHYRCIALCFTINDFNFDITDWWYEQCHSPNYDTESISTQSVMIKDLNIMEEISEEEFNKAYMKKTLKILNIDKVLKEKRFQDIENFKEENTN